MKFKIMMEKHVEAMTISRDKRGVAARVALVFIFILLCGRSGFGATGADLSAEMAKEFDYLDGKVSEAALAGDTAAMEGIHRILSNLEVTAGGLSDPQKRATAMLSIGFFYVRMSDAMLLAQLTRPDHVAPVNAAHQAEHFFNAAITASKYANTSMVEADTQFFVGAGYDALRARIAGVPGGDPKPYYLAALSHIRKAIAVGTSVNGAKDVLRDMERSDPKSRTPVVETSRFLGMHRSVSSENYINPNEDTGGEPVADGDLFRNFKWRFSIARPDNSWTFFSTDLKDGFHLLIRKAAGSAPVGSGVNVVCHALNAVEASMTLDKLVEKSLGVLKSAGYRIEKNSAVDFKGNPAIELVLTNKFSELGDKSVPAPPVVAKQRMLIVVSNGIEYIISFNSIASEYNAVLPTLKGIGDTLTPF